MNKLEYFYLSLAAGSQFKTARILEHPNILINFMSQTNNPPKYNYNKLFVDCGGFGESMTEGYYSKSDIEYLEYIEKVNPSFFALRDYSCSPKVLREHEFTVNTQIDRTLVNHLTLLNLLETKQFNIKSKPIPVIQGWKVKDYLYCIELYEKYNLISDYMAIGSIKGNKQMKKIISAVKKEIPGIKLHGFGVTISDLKNKSIWDYLYSGDSGSWDFTARWKKLKGELTGPEASIICAEKCLNKIEYLKDFHGNQTVLVGE